MRAFEGKIRLLFVIENGRPPRRHRVTREAVHCLIAALKLTGVCVFVTTGTFARRIVERDRRRAAADHRSMTLQTSHRAMSAQKCELRRGMIEGRRLLPGPHVMAKFAALLGIARCGALVRVLMAAYACHGIEMITGWRSRKSIHWGFVTFSASGGRVPAGQFELSFLVPRQRKCGRLKTIQGVA